MWGAPNVPRPRMESFGTVLARLKAIFGCVQAAIICCGVPATSAWEERDCQGGRSATCPLARERIPTTGTPAKPRTRAWLSACRSEPRRLKLWLWPGAGAAGPLTYGPRVRRPSATRPLATAFRDPPLRHATRARCPTPLACLRGPPSPAGERRR
eukprot:scaffold2045_cov404-Prasinococcus_capsulatus_cf.AAC.23